LTGGQLGEEEIKVKGLERAKRFTWERAARETLRVYGEVANVER